jgi:LPS export ABC transporter protein LptC
MIEMRPLKSRFLQLVTLVGRTVICSIFFLLFIVSCSNDKPDKIGAVVDRTKLPKLHATEITTIISDSGITRYRITAPRWDIYDKASKPYQEFPDGIYFEKFDANMKVVANIQSNYARFDENDQLWELRGKVRAMNIQGELFETEQLFWNQRQARFYSDKLIKITQATHIITGIGFESNETMTNYTIKKPQGVFPLNENAPTSAPIPAPQPVNPSINPSTNSKPKTAFPPVKSTQVIPPFHKTTTPNGIPVAHKKQASAKQQLKKD